MTENGQIETKSLESFEIKDETRGEVEAVVATLNVVDHDGDVILPGAIPSGAKVKLSFYGHGLAFGEAPVGKGTMSEENGKAMFRGRFFMTTDRGQEAFNTLKEMGPENEWSFGYPESSVRQVPRTPEWKAQGARRVIAGLLPIEVSPVFLGAGIGTGTVAVKSAAIAAREAEASAEAAEHAAGEAEAAAIRAEEEAAAAAAARLEVERTEAERKAAAEAEAQRLATERAELEQKAQEEEIRRKARAVEDREEYERVQRSLRRMGLR